MRVVVDASELASEKPSEPSGEGQEAEETSVPGPGEERTIIDELASFLSERLGREVLVSGSELTLEVDDTAGKKRVKQLLKKFLYKRGLDEDYRVISVGEGALKVKHRRFPKVRPGWA